jgi:uncharacterized ferredoxin-like protein
MMDAEDLLGKAILDVAGKMVIAARTAPKTRGRNTIETIVIDGDQINRLAKRMEALGEKTGAHYFARDAGNVSSSSCILLIGSRIQTMQLPYCGLCGFENCDTKEQHPEIPCAYNGIDLGIALGSAVSIAMDHRVDNRIMYTAGMAARDLNMMGEDIKLVLAVPLSASPKNIYFDRK